MLQIKSIKNLFIFVIPLVSLSFISCSSDDSDSDIKVTINGIVVFDDGDDFNGDVDGDFIGTGGNGSRTFLWRNNLNRADYNADITATSEGTFRMVVKDADGNVVLDKSLSGAVEPDSFDGVTSSGTSGIWSVTITLTSFKGDGSFSLSEGD
ncbi:hypothetical protein [Seonamhaeicola maritimus]|uniref:hypothetical protein n=1 Tax=Seonamhaeicola maritimus TaxID=2591822 RepID=UPI002494FA24|nr:hypothetical protein [Seonamhaeicola maritimus]